MTSKTYPCDQLPRSHTLPVFAKRSPSLERKTAVVESIKGSDSTSVEDEYADAIGRFIFACSVSFVVKTR